MKGDVIETDDEFEESLQKQSNSSRSLIEYEGILEIADENIFFWTMYLKYYFKLKFDEEKEEWELGYFNIISQERSLFGEKEEGVIKLNKAEIKEPNQCEIRIVQIDDDEEKKKEIVLRARYPEEAKAWNERISNAIKNQQEISISKLISSSSLVAEESTSISQRIVKESENKVISSFLFNFEFKNKNKQMKMKMKRILRKKLTNLKKQLKLE